MNKRREIWNLPNSITLARISVVPFLFFLLASPGPFWSLTLAALFVLAALTDFLDGYIARKYNLITTMGKFLDPLADKVLICSVLIMFVQLGWTEAWVVIIMVCRELVVTGLRAIAIDEGIVLAADKFGKAKTILQVFAIVPLIVHYPLWGMNPQPIGQVLLYAALALALISGTNYCYDFYRRTSERKESGKA